MALGRLKRKRPREGQDPTCPVCGETNRADAQFCRFCGATMESTVSTPEPARSPSVRLRRPPWLRRWHAVAGIVAVVVVGIVVTALVSGDGDPADRRAALRFATVRRADIVSVRSLDGEVVSRGEGPRILSRLSGTLTDVAAERSTVERGQSIYAINGEPVILFYGALPAWREIGPGVSDGADVEQLEGNLEALRFEPGDVDEKFTPQTEEAVNEWLSSVGLPQGGSVPLGRVVFARAAVTVAEQLKGVGGPVQDGDEIMSALSFEKVVTVSFSNENDLTSGERVTVALPGKDVPGRVTSVVTDPGAGRGEELFLLATVVPDEAGALLDLREGADVDIEVFDASRQDVLAVPVTALLAREGGGYAVEVQRSGGRLEVVRVSPGLYANELVEIRSGLREGDRVVVP